MVGPVSLLAVPKDKRFILNESVSSDWELCREEQFISWESMRYRKTKAEFMKRSQFSEHTNDEPLFRSGQQCRSKQV
jgi:hypothetical protein